MSPASAAAGSLCTSSLASLSLCTKHKTVGENTPVDGPGPQEPGWPREELPCWSSLMLYVCILCFAICEALLVI